MNFNKIIKLMQDADPEFYERTSPRRHILKSFTSKVAVAAAPFALSAFFKKAYGQGNAAPVYYEALTFALKLEYFEDGFYQKVLNDPSALTDVAAKNAYTKIAADETAHVNFLKYVIDSTGSHVIPRPNFDYTGGAGTQNGRYKDWYTDYLKLLELTQTIEDIGAAAYRGASIPIMPNNYFLSSILSIHSVEARHSARIRTLRMQAGVQNLRPWVMNNSTEMVDPVLGKSYARENNTMAAGFDITGLNGEKISADAARSAFDEPLNKDEVMKLLEPFIVP